MKKTNFPWTEKELAVLSNAANLGLIPVIEGRSRGAILLKMTSLGLRESPKKFWDERELEILRSFSGSGLPDVSGRNRNAVRAKMKELGLVSVIKNWSPEQIEELKGKVAGSSKIEIEGRSHAAVLKKIHDLGLMREYSKNRRKGNSNLKWSEEELDLVRKGSEKVEGRSRCAVMDMRLRLGLKAPRRPRPYWTPEKERLIKSLHLKGLSAKKMMDHFRDRTAMAIQKKLCRMGLAKKMTISRLPKRVEKILREFVSENWKTLTPGQMTERWNAQNPEYKVNKGRTRKTMRQIGVKIRFSMPIEVRSRLKKFVKKSWVSDLELDDKLSSIAESWNQLNPDNQVSPKRIRAVAAELILVRKKMPDVVKLKLKKFLSEKWEGRTTDELVEMWNVVSNHKTNKLMVSRLLNELDLKIECSEVKRMNNLRVKEKKIMSAGASNSKALDEMIRAERVKLMRSRFGSNKDIFTGMRIQGEEVLAETL